MERTLDEVLPDPIVAIVKPLLRGWSHLLALAACSVLVCLVAVRAEGASATAATIIYAAGLTTMLGVSALYHRVRWGARGLSVMSRLDHTTIYFGIAATYTPVAVLVLSGWSRVAVLLTAWIGAAIGSSIVWLPIRTSRVFSAITYAVVGWAAIIALPQLITGLGGTGFGLIFGGGIAYTLGAVVYALRRPDPWPRVFGFHEVFHACTIVGVGTHLAAIGLVIVPSA